MAAGLPEDMKQRLWAKGVRTPTRLCNSMVTKIGLQNSHKMFYGQEEIAPNLLHRVEEMAVVGKRDAIKAKLADRRETLIYVGYSQDHVKDVYRFYNMVTCKIVQSRDVTWLGKLYSEDVDKLIQSTDLSSSPDKSQDEMERKEKKKLGEGSSSKERKLRSALKKITTLYNPVELPEDNTLLGIAELKDLAFASLENDQDQASHCRAKRIGMATGHRSRT
jgi:hypothetical protein